MTDCNICMLRKEELENLIRTDTELSFNLLASITDRLNETEQKLISLALEDAREKTMRLLWIWPGKAERRVVKEIH